MSTPSNPTNIPQHVIPKVKRSNWRVVIEPRRLGDYGWVRTSDRFGGISDAQIESEYADRCASIKADVERHVDSVGSVYVDHDEEKVCPHCGHEWAPDDSGVNQCCNKEMQAWAVARWGTHSSLVREVMGDDWRPPTTEATS